MILERSVDPRALSNAWLVAASPGDEALFVDSGAPLAPLLAAVERERLRPVWVLCTHHHPDHVEHNGELVERFGCRVAAHPLDAGAIGRVDRRLEDGESLQVGPLMIRAIHVPGHTRGQLAFLVDGRHVFTGDTLFRRSVGGTRGPGHGTFEELRHSILDRLLALPDATLVHPGHGHDSTIGAERRENPFVLAWRLSPAPRGRDCRVGGRAARLLLRAPDYDGGTKAWVRFEDGSEAVVGGSQVVG